MPHKMITHELADDIVAFGERMALLMEQQANIAGMEPWQCTMALPAMISFMLKRLSKKEPGAITTAGEGIIGLLQRYLEIEEEMRRKEWH